MKYSLKHLVATSALLIAGASASLLGDLTDTITQSIIKQDGTPLTPTSHETPMRCRNIGKYGRTLAALPRKTKDAILDLCENEFLGLKYNGDREIQFDEESAKKGLIAPRAWFAVIDTSKRGYKVYESYDDAFKAAKARSDAIYKKEFGKQAPTPPAPPTKKIKFPQLPS